MQKCSPLSFEIRRGFVANQKVGSKKGRFIEGIRTDCNVLAEKEKTPEYCQNLNLTKKPPPVCFARSTNRNLRGEESQYEIPNSW
jgi:hypothetical protein